MLGYLATQQIGKIMFGFLRRKRSFSDQLKAITEIEEKLRFCLYLRLKLLFEADIDGETASVLAVQVSNHLMGDDFTKVYETLSSETKQKVDEIRDVIALKAHEVMTRDGSIRELIIRHIMTTYLIYHCLFDKSWFDKPEIRNREKLIQKYGGSEISEVDDFNQYIAFVSEFIQTTREEHS